MKNKTIFFNAGLVLILLTACASQTGWQPTVDPYNDPRAAYVNQDLVECKMLAQRVSGYTPGQTAEGALIGGAIGAAAGAAIGAVAGAPGKGAAIGAAAGGIGGGTYKGLDAESKYKNAYIRCMRQRGHNVLN